jgi:hypothetical protein
MVSIFIEGEKLDLFGDEKISIVSKSTDIENLEKIFTDFSQPFSVPSSPNNDRIFKHYYNLNIDNGLNVNIRNSGYIEYFTLPFRYGTVQ